MGEIDNLPLSVSERALTAIEIVSVLPILVLAGVAVVEIVYSEPDPQSGMFVAYIIIVWPFVSSISVTVLGFISLVRYFTDLTVRKLDLVLIFVHTFAAAYIIILFSTDVGTVQNESDVLFPLGVVIGSSIILTIHILIQTSRVILR